jgi:hypothetical protein
MSTSLVVYLPAQDAAMKPLFSLVPLLTLITPQSPTAQSPPKKEECTIAGTVVKLADSEPLRSARVLAERR